MRSRKRLYRPYPRVVPSRWKMTSTSGSLSDGVFNKTTSVLKKAVLAPMPKPSERTATALNPGLG